MRLRFGIAILLILGLFGCGGGGKTPAVTGPVSTFQLAINWSARSRDVSAPSSALSAVITISNPNSPSKSFVVRRRADLVSYTEKVTSPFTYPTGQAHLVIQFYAANDGGGAVVGRAESELKINADGTLSNLDGSALGQIETTGKVSSVSISAGQSVDVGYSTTLSITVKDSANNIIAVSPGSAFFSLYSGGEFITLDSSGNVTGKSLGAATVTATVDGIQSLYQPVLVTSHIPVKRLNLVCNDIGYDRKSGLLFASVPSIDKTGHGNCIVSLNPQTLAIVRTVFVGSEPNRIAISDDGRFLYVGLDGAGSIRRVDLQTMTADLLFSLGSDSFLGTKSCRDIAVMPGQSHTIAVSTSYSGVSPSFADLKIFDDGVSRAQFLSSPFDTIDWIAFGADSGKLYGLNSEDSSNSYTQMIVDASGITVRNRLNDLLFSYGQITYSNGNIYSNFGRVLEAEGAHLLGTLNVNSGYTNLRPTQGFAVDAASNRTCFLIASVENSFLQLDIYNNSSFTKTSSSTIALISDYTEFNIVPRMVSCGQGRFAFITHAGQHPELGQVVVVTPGG